MDEKKDTPRNELDEPPTERPEETEARLREKERDELGTANRRRAEERISAVKRQRGDRKSGPR